jgi:hypothetical protein
MLLVANHYRKKISQAKIWPIGIDKVNLCIITALTGNQTVRCRVALCTYLPKEIVAKAGDAAGTNEDVHGRTADFGGH